MVPPGGRQGGSGEDDIDHQSAKRLLDSIGKKVHDKVKSEAEQRSNGELKGNLASPSILGETVAFSEPCGLIKDKGENLIGDRGDPCGNVSASEKRYSKERVDEYDEKKIKGNKGKESGACAPYRRLHLCNKNMEKIATSMTTHKLLAEVCLAAKHEGESLKGYHEQYEVQYPSSGSTMCTELARSFADIGDIVRGRDLYIGNRKEKEKLQNTLKQIFQNIQKENKGLNDLTLDQIREYWWALNRKDVWKAITCDEENKLGGYSYFRATCDTGKGPSVAQKQCRCDKDKGAKDADQVPTYFDYVPQFLRWFEEWAEDFCRKRRKKLENAKNKCRGEYEGEKRYCSGNGCDCKKTVRARGKLRYGNRCIDCLYACNPYVHWIDKKKEEFDKQVKKYQTEIEKYTNGGGGSGGRRLRRSAPKENYEGYEKKFYNILKNKRYGNVDAFLGLLNNETDCQNVDDPQGGTINFKEEHGYNNNEAKGTFYHSEYCQPCPYCGMKRTNKGSNEWERKRADDNCKNIKLYKPINGKNGTPIKILKSGEKQKEIENKLNEFCNNKKSEKVSLFEAWECYEGKDVEKVKNGEEEDDEEEVEDVKKAGGLCILKNDQRNEENKAKTQKEPDEIQKTYNDFFTYWVAHMLKDSIYWKKKLVKCLKNGNPMKCKDKCKGDCDCFQKWIEQKKKDEWKPIKDHFYKQDDIRPVGDLAALMTHDIILEGVLKLEFYKEKSAEDNQNSLDEEEAEELKHLRQIIESEENQDEDAGGASD
ncbi:hypothetical protein PFTANZ_00929, partial [Plasmodium falciparum Tanzania (2000708)]